MLRRRVSELHITDALVSVIHGAVDDTKLAFRITISGSHSLMVIFKQSLNILILMA